MSKSRKTDSALRGLIGQAPNPIYLLDANRIIRYCNDACARWVGTDATDLIGRQCDYHSMELAETDGVAAHLCPHLDAFSGRRCAGIVAARNSAGQLRRRSADFLPLESDVGCHAVLAVVGFHDLTSQQVDQLMSGKPDSTNSIDPLHEQIRQLREQMKRGFELDRLVGNSDAMRRVRKQVRLAGRTTTRTVIIGPPGSGRERTARTIDAIQSSEPTSPLIPMDCSLLDAELIQSTIEALLRRTAELEEEGLAKLLLLEVDQLPPDGQAALAGFVLVDALNLHTLATSRQNLVGLARAGSFRADLAHALSTLEIEIPGLADRPEDIPLLTQAAIEQINAQGGRQVSGISQAAIEMLLAHTWHDNADELFAVVAEAHAASHGRAIDVADLPVRLRLSADAQRHPRRVDETIELDRYLSQIELELVQRALENANGNRAKAARLLGISRSRLLRRIEALGIDT